MAKLLLKSENLFLFLVKEWFELDSMCLLDSSFCNGELRTEYSKLISTIVVDWPSKKFLVSQSFRWLQFRSISMTKFVLNNKVLVDRSLSSYLSCFRVTHVKLNHLNERNIPFLQLVLRECIVMEDLDLSQSKFINDGIIYTVANFCPNLSLCNLSGLLFISDYTILSLSRGCTRMIEVNLSHCSLLTEKAVLQLLINCASLTSLNLSHCERFVSVIGILRQTKFHPTLLSKLSYLNLFGCGLSNRNKEVDTLLALCTALTSLDIGQVGSKDDIGDSTLTALACCCTGLTSLNLSGPSAATDEGVTTLVNACRRLQHVDMSRLAHVSLKSVLEVTNKLEVLRSVACGQSGDGSLSADHALRVLSSKFDKFFSLDLTALRVEGLPMSRRPQQFMFHFADHNGLSNPADGVLDCSVEMILFKCDELHSFTAGETTTPATLHSLVAIAGKNLTLLQLSAMATCLSDADVLFLSNHCSALRSLSVTSCAALTDTSVSAVLKANTEITSLDCSGCSLLSDVTLISLSTHCTRLTALVLDDCIQMTDKGVSQVAKRCDALTVISLLRCALLTDKSINLLMQHCHQLRELRLSGCKASKTCLRAVEQDYS
jgi:hypothetical protein